MKWIHSDDDLAAACRRLQLPVEAEAMAREPQRLDGISGGGRFEEAAEQVLDEHHEVWRRLGHGAIGG